MMHNWIYFGALVFSLSGLACADYRYKMALFWKPKKVAVTLLLGIAFFLMWDITGIALDVFHTNPHWVSGLYIGIPDLPIEEFLFLALLNYQIILFWRLAWLRRMH